MVRRKGRKARVRYEIKRIIEADHNAGVMVGITWLMDISNAIFPGTPKEFLRGVDSDYARLDLLDSMAFSSITELGFAVRWREWERNGNWGRKAHKPISI